MSEELDLLVIENHELRQRCGELRLAGAQPATTHAEKEAAKADARQMRARYDRVVAENKQLCNENKALRAWLEAVRVVVAEYRP